METAQTPRLYEEVDPEVGDKDLLDLEGTVELPGRGRLEAPVTGRVAAAKKHHQMRFATKNYNGPHFEEGMVEIWEMALFSEAAGYQTTEKAPLQGYLGSLLSPSVSVGRNHPGLAVDSCVFPGGLLL